MFIRDGECNPIVQAIESVKEMDSDATIDIILKLTSVTYKFDRQHLIRLLRKKSKFTLAALRSELRNVANGLYARLVLDQNISRKEAKRKAYGI